MWMSSGWRPRQLTPGNQLALVGRDSFLVGLADIEEVR